MRNLCFISVCCILLSHGYVYCCSSNRHSSSKNSKSGRNDRPSSNPKNSASTAKDMLGDNVKIAPDDNSGFDNKNGKASSPDDLRCDFEKPCCWKNSKPPYDTMDYLRATGQPDAKKFQSNFGTSVTPTGTYMIAMTDSSTGSVDKAEYESCVIPCANDNIQVSVKHWASSGVKIQVCEVSQSDPNSLLACQDLPATSPGPDTVVLPAGQSISVVIVATNFVKQGNNMAIIDDISVQYTSCDGSVTNNPFITSQTNPNPNPNPGPITQGPSSNAGECQKLLCDFEAGLCNYNKGSGPSDGGAGGTVKPWEIHQNRFMNIATGVPPAPDGSHYAGAYLKPQEKAYMEASSNFEVDKVIKFQEYKATQDVNLRVCCDRTEGCLYDTGNEVKKADYHQWYQGAIMCPKGTQKVIFYAENKGRNEGGVAIDNIQLYQSNGGDPNAATTPLC